MIAICSAIKEAYIAIDINDKKIFSKLDSNCKHSENILPKINEMLDNIEETLNNNDCYAVVVGPGSFTGIRIGVSLVKGFCAGETKDVVPLSTLGLMAYSYVKTKKPQNNFACILNALSGLCFYAEFDKTGEMIEKEKLLETKDVRYDEINVISLKGENLSQNSIEIEPEDLLEYAQNQRKKGVFVDAKLLQPLYLRKSQAEVGLEQKKLEKK